MIKVKLTDELSTSVKKGNTKTIDVVKHIIITVPAATTEKSIEDTALKDISIDGKFITKATFDTWYNEIILEF